MSYSVIPALGGAHNPGMGEIAAICVATGGNGGVCSICGELIMAFVTYPIDPNNHAGGTYESVITAATYDANGLMGIYCEDCDKLLNTRVIPKLTGDKDGIISAASASFISIVEIAKNSRVWVLTFKVTVTYANGEKEVKTYSINLNGNNANQDGKYTFDEDHDLAGYTLVYDLKGNGANIKEFKLIMN